MRRRTAAPSPMGSRIPAFVPHRGPVQAEEQPDGRRLSRTVGSEETEHLSWHDLEADVADAAAHPESLRQAVHHHYGRRHCRPPSRVGAASRQPFRLETDAGRFTVELGINAHYGTGNLLRVLGSVQGKSCTRNGSRSPAGCHSRGRWLRFVGAHPPLLRRHAFRCRPRRMLMIAPVATATHTTVSSAPSPNPITSTSPDCHQRPRVRVAMTMAADGNTNPQSAAV